MIGSGRSIEGLWIGEGAVLAAAAAAFVPFSESFGYAYTVAEMPVLWLVAALMAVGIVALLLPALIARTEAADPARRRRLLLGMIATGLVLRLMLMASEPALEDDYQRYLFDGGTVAAGFNPYSIVPADAMAAAPVTPLGQLAAASGEVLGRINHPELSTVYPPVAQALFVLAHLIAPYKLWAWRIVCLAGESASLVLIILLLQRLGRNPLWAALYWWNPLVLKELANSAHMEAVLMPFVLGAVVSLAAGRHVLAAFVLALAAGVKIWPALLLPLVLAPLLSNPRRLLTALLAFAVPAAIFAFPMVLTGLHADSGLVAYAEGWRTNNAVFPALVAMAGGERPARILVGVALLLTTLVVAWRARGADQSGLVHAAAFTCGAALLLSPAQFPWYAAWVTVFLPFLPVTAFLILSVTMPLYYTAFHFMARGDDETFARLIVPIEWAPVLALLALIAIDRLRQRA